MIKINVSDEKLLDELTLVLKLFFDSEEIENLNYEFNIEQNVVDLDIETSEMSKNVLMIQALDSASKKHSDIFKSVIDASSKI